MSTCIAAYMSVQSSVAGFVKLTSADEEHLNQQTIPKIKNKVYHNLFTK